MGDGCESVEASTGSKETQSLEVKDVIAMKRDKLMRLVSQGGVEIQVTKATEVKKIIARAFGVQTSYINGEGRNRTKTISRAVGLYVYILHEKLRMSQQEIINHYKGKVANSTMSRWIRKGKEEVENNPTAKKLYDSIEYIGI